VADDALLQIGQELAGADLELHVLALATGKGLAVELAEEIHGHVVTALGGAAGLDEIATRTAQVLDQALHVGVGNLHPWLFDLERGEVGELDLRVHLKVSGVFQRLARLFGGDVDLGLARGRDPGLAQRLGIGLVDQIGHGVEPGGFTVLLGDDLERRLARAKARHLGTLGHAPQALIHRLGHAVGGHLDPHRTAQAARHFDLNFHL
jgi:hypothetical protein